MKILGHPVHMMLIHFPSALLPMDLICSVLGYYTGMTTFVEAGFFAMTGGVTLGILAIVTGAFDLIAVAEDKPLALKTALIHGGINTAVIMGYSILAFRAYREFPDLVPDVVSLLIVKGCLVLFMLAGNYFGGSLILKYRVGMHND